MKVMTRKRKLISIIQNFFQRFGFVVRKANGFYEATRDIGREYSDDTDTLPRFILNKEPALPWAGQVTKFTINNGKSLLEETIYYSHLTLLQGICMKNHLTPNILSK